VRGQDVFLIQTLTAPVSHHIMEMLILIDTIKRANVGRITAVMPYYAYGRSDKKDQPRVPITARLLADLVHAAGADRFLTLDLHPVFEERYHNTKERFEFETDWHWNALGHRVTAESVRDLLIQRKLIETQRDEALRNTASVEYP
jgi:hypothetical protein